MAFPRFVLLKVVLLGVLVVAAAHVSHDSDDVTDRGIPSTSSSHHGPGGRFRLTEESGAGRSLLNIQDPCGQGNSPAYNCARILPRGSRRPVCCSSPRRQCRDIGATDRNNCGACNRRCSWNEICCGGRCYDSRRNSNHCGRCNIRCPRGFQCIQGTCGYNGHEYR
uniref:Stigma-specific Stig1 family protein n=1 Tax=Physcomitrium patens TaxID=3218 RepID=A0A2K1KPL0_PHYPA|nr:stigma-specific STIG1-like protein 1 [Physcomitrium patens]PNR55723.1 hypothetical protein PHYPA_006620 [Physcomitrium patens]|eukprot:XP_024372933.1 stigma-specific STIG1-like protein 1 [Physcomitrella patens]